MESDGGMTVFQRRVDSSEAFGSRKWSEYVNGFGEKTKARLGLDNIHYLTVKDKDVNVTVNIRFDLYGDQNVTGNCPPIFLDQCYPNGRWYGIWQGFNVGSREEQYKLNVGARLHGNMSEAEDFLIYNGTRFTTVDKDNDNFNSSCGNRNYAACMCGGGWWYPSANNTCFNGLRGLNGGGSPNDNCFFWLQQVTRADGTHSWWRSPKTSELKLRKRIKDSDQLLRLS